MKYQVVTRLSALDGLAKIIALAFRRCPDCGERFIRGRVDRKLRVICRKCHASI